MMNLKCSSLLVCLGFLLAGCSTAAPTAVGICGTATLSSCRTTNQLVWAPSMTQAMEEFFGEHADLQVSYLYSNGPLLDQIWAVLGGPPEDREDLKNGGFLFAACRQHSCPEKGAVAFDTEGRIKAVGILNFKCQGGSEGCSDGRQLDLFFRDDDAATEASILAVKNWAASVTEESLNSAYPVPFYGTVLHRLN